MDLDVDFRSDVKKETEGVPVDFGDGGIVGIAAWGNPRFQRKLEEEMKPVQFQLEQGTLPASKNKAIMDKVIAETIVTSLTNIKMAGEVIEYSPAAVEKILADPKYHRFREAVIAASKEQSAYQEKVVAQKAKN